MTRHTTENSPDWISYLLTVTWAAYDHKAVGTQFGNAFRRPQAERTTANKNTAVSYAAYRALLNLYADQKDVLAEQMRRRGLDPDNASTELSTPEGVGNVAAAAVIDFRRHDGANQYGDEDGSNGQPYSDYTHYQPINPALLLYMWVVGVWSGHSV